MFCDDLVSANGRLGLVHRTFHEDGAEDEFNDADGNLLPPVRMPPRVRSCPLSPRRPSPLAPLPLPLSCANPLHSPPDPASQLERGQVRVRWMGSDDVDTRREDELVVIDRVCAIGDIVQSQDPAKAGVSGEVVSIRIMADTLPMTEVQQRCLGNVEEFRYTVRVGHTERGREKLTRSVRLLPKRPSPHPNPRPDSARSPPENPP